MKISEATILVVDDEPALREIFENWLSMIGCERVIAAPDGKVALEVLARERIDVLMTDVRMPVMDGVSLVRAMAKLDVSPPSIVFVSGFGDVSYKEMYALGVEAFISKPIDRKELVRVLEHALAKREELWASPMIKPPRQSMTIDVKQDESDEGRIRLGRGGFSARYGEPLALSKVTFKCRLASQRVLVGEGYVRWITRSDKTVGIEFAYLDEASRAWVLEEIHARAPRGFIPNFEKEPENSVNR